MFTNETMVAVFFRLFNFCLIVSLAVYGFKKYILSGILAAMAKNMAEQECLIAEQSVLERRLIDLEKLLQCDSDAYRCSITKIDEWKRAVVRQKEIYQKEREKRHAALIEREKNKREWQKKMILQSLIAKKVTADLQASLSEYFNQESVGKEYLEKVLHSMDERLL